MSNRIQRHYNAPQLGRTNVMQSKLLARALQQVQERVRQEGGNCRQSVRLTFAIWTNHQQFVEFLYLQAQLVENDVVVGRGGELATNRTARLRRNAALTEQSAARMRHRRLAWKAANRTANVVVEHGVERSFADERQLPNDSKTHFFGFVFCLNENL